MTNQPMVLVTGAASGIGATTAQMLRAAGAEVIAADVVAVDDPRYVALDLCDPRSTPRSPSCPRAWTASSTSPVSLGLPLPERSSR